MALGFNFHCTQRCYSDGVRNCKQRRLDFKEEVSARPPFPRMCPFEWGWGCSQVGKGFCCHSIFLMIISTAFKLNVFRSSSEVARLPCLQNPFLYNPERILWKSFLNSQTGICVRLVGRVGEGFEGFGGLWIPSSSWASSCLFHLREG